MPPMVECTLTSFENSLFSMNNVKFYIIILDIFNVNNKFLVFSLSLFSLFLLRGDISLSRYSKFVFR